MVSDITKIGIAMGLFFVVACAGMVYMCCDSRKGWKTIEMNEPLIMEAGSRTDEALKAVERGSTACTKCSFANLTHLKFCAVCGDALGDASARKKALKTRGPLTQTAEAAVAVRGARASRRGEWVRKTDVQGKVFWFRAPTSTTTQQQPGFVARFDGVAMASAPLNDQVANLTVQWLDPTSSSTDALTFSVGSGVLLSSAQELLAVSTQPFPAKYTTFVNRTSALASPQGTSSSGMQLRFRSADKDDMFLKSMTQLTVLSQDDLRGPIIVRYALGTAFANSTKSVDWHKDWLAVLQEKLTDPATGLFTRVNDVDQTYYINPNSQALLGDDHLNYFYAAGRLIGRALLQGDLMAFHMATPLLKILLGQPLSFHDLEHFDPVTYKNLKYLLENKNVESLDLDFSVQEKRGGANGQVVTIDLIPNGRNIQVTDANKMEYLTRKTQHVLVESVRAQLYALTKGFYEVVPQELLLIFDAEELDYVLCGSDEIDVDEWERASKYNQFLFDHPAKRYFWRFVREMPEDYKRRLLHFATGSTRVPIGGFAALQSWDGRLSPFSLQSVELVDGKLLKSEPCFNKVILPMHIDKKKMKALLYATLDPETYEFVVAK